MAGLCCLLLVNCLEQDWQAQGHLLALPFSKDREHSYITLVTSLASSYDSYIQPSLYNIHNISLYPYIFIC